MSSNNMNPSEGRYKPKLVEYINSIDIYIIMEDRCSMNVVK